MYMYIHTHILTYIHARTHNTHTHQPDLVMIIERGFTGLMIEGLCNSECLLSTPRGERKLTVKLGRREMERLTEARVF